MSEPRLISGNDTPQFYAIIVCESVELDGEDEPVVLRGLLKNVEAGRDEAQVFVEATFGGGHAKVVLYPQGQPSYYVLSDSVLPMARGCAGDSLARFPAGFFPASAFGLRPW